MHFCLQRTAPGTRRIPPPGADEGLFLNVQFSKLCIVSGDLFFARRSLRETPESRSIMSSPLFIFPSQLCNYDWIPPRLLGRGGNMRLVMTAALQVTGKTVRRPDLSRAARFRRLGCVTSLLTFASPLTYRAQLMRLFNEG